MLRTLYFTMPALSLPEDKPKIVFHSVMMAAQNLGFMIFYWDIWGATPGPLINPINNTIIEDPCLDTRYAVGMMAITCFLVTFLEIGFAMGGYIDDTATFFFYWILHLIGGLGFYTQCTITIPLAMFADNSDDWVTKSKCGDMNYVNSERLHAVFATHAACYIIYVGGMLAITWFSFVKPTFCSSKKLTHKADSVEMGVQ